MKTLLLVSLSFVTVPALVGSSVQDPQPAPARMTIAELGWLEGSWRGKVRDDAIDEHWSPAAGGARMGMFRWQKQERVWLYEFMTLTDGERGPRLRIKHFSADLVGHEPKDQATEFEFESGDATSVTFVDPKGTRLLYRRDGERLSVTLDKARGAQRSALEFVYSRG